MAIYTKTGDDGSTCLANGQRVQKSDARIEAYGTSDELNSWVGLLRAKMTALEWMKEEQQLCFVQNKLFNLGAELSLAPGCWIVASDITMIEQWIDQIQSQIPAQHAFILPSGGELSARCHVCRTICRRLERKMIEIGCPNDALVFVNRLSDYFFVMARLAVLKTGEKEEKWIK